MQNEITSQTTLIIIGDARNNYRETGEICLKNLARKARKSYWLNTEPECQWGTGDSIAPLYAKYMPMIPVLNTRDLISFITNI